MKQLFFPSFVFSLLLMVSFMPSDKKPFPKITGITLNDKEVTLPNADSKKFTLVAIATSIKAEEDLEGWIEPVYTSIMGNMMFHADMYFIPMTGGLKGVSNETVKRKLKESMDTSLYKYVLLYTGPTSEYVKTLKMKDSQVPWFFVIDPLGNITYSTSGKYTEEKLEEITDKLSE